MAIDPKEKEAFKKALQEQLSSSFGGGGGGGSSVSSSTPPGWIAPGRYKGFGDVSAPMNPDSPEARHRMNQLQSGAKEAKTGLGLRDTAIWDAQEKKGGRTVQPKDFSSKTFGDASVQFTDGSSSTMSAAESRAAAREALEAEEDEAKGEIYGWDDNELNSFRNQLTLAGYKGDEMSRADLISAWNSLVTMSINYQRSGKKVTPFDILSSEVPMAQRKKKEQENLEFQQNIQGDFYINPENGEKTYLGPRQITQVNRDVNYTDPNTARELVNKTMQNFLGRDPTNAEVQDFTSALHAAQKANPVTTSRVQRFSEAGDLEGTDTFTVGGVNEGSLAEAAAKDMDEYASVQAATTYMDALRSMVYGAY